METSKAHLRLLARVECNAQQGLMEIVASLTHVNMCLRPTASEPPSTAAHLCMLLAEVGQFNGLLTVSQVHETSLRDVQ
jgi:hypothetical protein